MPLRRRQQPMSRLWPQAGSPPPEEVLTNETVPASRLAVHPRGRPTPPNRRAVRRGARGGTLLGDRPRPGGASGGEPSDAWTPVRRTAGGGAITTPFLGTFPRRPPARPSDLPAASPQRPTFYKQLSPEQPTPGPETEAVGRSPVPSAPAGRAAGRRGGIASAVGDHLPAEEPEGRPRSRRGSPEVIAHRRPGDTAPTIPRQPPPAGKQDAIMRRMRRCRRTPRGEVVRTEDEHQRLRRPDRREPPFPCPTVGTESTALPWATTSPRPTKRGGPHPPPASALRKTHRTWPPTLRAPGRLRPDGRPPISCSSRQNRRARPLIPLSIAPTRAV